MRAVDFYLFIMCINAAIGLINMSGVFAESFFVADANQEYQYEVDDIENLAPQDPSFVDYAIMAITFLAESLLFLAKMALSFVYIYPTLTTEFMFPAYLSAFFQSLLVATWIIGYVQWKANRQMRGMY